MSQWLDMQPGGSAWLGDWGTTGQGVSSAVSDTQKPVVKTQDSTMLYLTGAGVVLAALALFTRRGR
jgi:hypothetical protein